MLAGDPPGGAWQRRDRLTYRCPACGNQTLIIDNAGWLVCGWLPCKNPSALHEIIKHALSAAPVPDQTDK